MPSTAAVVLGEEEVVTSVVAEEISGEVCNKVIQSEKKWSKVNGARINTAFNILQADSAAKGVTEEGLGEEVGQEAADTAGEATEGSAVAEAEDHHHQVHSQILSPRRLIKEAAEAADNLVEEVCQDLHQRPTPSRSPLIKEEEAEDSDQDSAEVAHRLVHNLRPSTRTAV